MYKVIKVRLSKMYRFYRSGERKFWAHLSKVFCEKTNLLHLAFSSHFLAIFFLQTPNLVQVKLQSVL